MRLLVTDSAEYTFNMYSCLLKSVTFLNFSDIGTECKQAAFFSRFDKQSGYSKTRIPNLLFSKIQREC